MDLILEPTLTRTVRRFALPAALILAVALTLPASSPALAAGTPTFVQKVTAHKLGTATLAVTPAANTVAGNRLIVEVGVWNSVSATISSVTDNAGDTFTKLLSYAAADHTELSVWTAVVATGGTKPIITARATSAADIGLAALEYSGMSTVAGTGVVDQEAHAFGVSTAAATVSSGTTAAVGPDGAIALGFYADSGFGTTPTAGTGYTARATIAGVSDMDILVEDRPVSAGATVSATTNTQAAHWLQAVIVLKGVSGPPPDPTAPGAPTGVAASPGNASATVVWTAPDNGGSPITSYTLTPYIGGTAQTPTTATSSPATVSGLTNGTAYTFTVSATNAIGTGPASAPSAPVTPGVPQGGSWSALQTWPIVALSNTLFYNGTTVSWDGWQQPQPSVVWNPASPSTFTTINAPDSVFCDGAASLPDGRLLVAGGFGGLSTGQLGIVDTNIFDPVTSTWTQVANMNLPRWYPTVTELADGRYVAISGNDTNGSHWADTPEVYDPATDTWTLLTGVSTPQVHEVEYPFSYLLPSGKVFTIGPSEDNSFLLDVNNRTWTQVGGASGVRNGSSVMYLPGKVLYSGGGANVNASGAAYANASVIDLNAATPQWQPVAPMGAARVYHNLTVLPDGKVLAVGGAPNTDQNIVTTGVLTTEIWDPATQTWTTGASMDASRNYHSVSLLMPDGRVLVTGGGHPFSNGGPAQYSGQFYSPAYLSNGARPAVTSAPGAAAYGGSFTVSTPDAASITAVNLVSLGAVTHQIDMNQHFVPLSFTRSGTDLTVQAPATAALAPPGYYMLFLINDHGVPSVAKMVQMRQTLSAPAAPTGVTAFPGNASATVNWTAPNTGGSPITSYTVTPYIGGTAQPPTTVTGNPPAVTAAITGLTNGTAYTFTVKATNAIGTSPASTASAPVTPTASPAPAFVQQNSTQGAGSATRSVTLPAPLGPGNRLVVAAGIWNSSGSVITNVTDSAGDSFVKVGNITASDNTELSVWTAPVTSGAGQAPSITATASGSADIGLQAIEYAGLSTVADLTAVDQKVFGAGRTAGAATVSSAATPAATGGNEVALGFYADSGFGTALTGGSGWTVRANMSPNSNMDMLTESQAVSAGGTPSASVGTGANTTWLMATVIFKPGGPPPPPTEPAAPTGVTASAGNASATVSWQAPSNGGSTITAYTVTPYLGGVAQPPIDVTGTPPATSVTVNGLTNGAAYTFAVSATNAVGTGPQSTQSAPVTPTASPPPAFVQQVNSQQANKTAVTVTPASVTTAGNRLIVEVGVWNSSAATVSSVTDNAGDTFTKVTSIVASDKTQLSIWTAVVATGGTKPAITATVTSSADVGVVALEYSGLSAAAGLSAVDQIAQASGTTSAAGAVTSGPTPATTADSELAIGFYADSGFGKALTAGTGWTSRANVSPNGNMDMLVEDKSVALAATPAATTNTGASVVWLQAVVVFRRF